MLLDEYFLKIQHSILQCPVVSSKTVNLQARTDYRGLIKGTLSFIDQTELHFTEVVDLKIKTEKVKYRYHYQEMDTHRRIFRYDNARHFPRFATFPHHKHIGPETDPDKVLEASEMSLEEVLREIEEYVIAHI